MAKRTKQILKEFFTGNAFPTGAQFAELIDSLIDNLAPTTLEIVSGAITVTQRRHLIDTESQTATDDLDTINGGADGDELLMIASAGITRTVVVKDGTGNIDMAADVSLNSTILWIYLIYNGATAKWNQIA